jgi:hypothetical protein
MTSDWEQIRRLMNAAIDGLAAADALQIEPADRGRTTQVGGHRVSIQDALTSAWTGPENLRDEVVRARGRLGEPAPYTPDTARALLHVAQLCAALVGTTQLDAPYNDAGDTLGAQLDALTRWYSASRMNPSGFPEVGLPPGASAKSQSYLDTSRVSPGCLAANRAWEDDGFIREAEYQGHLPEVVGRALTEAHHPTDL